MKIVLIAGGFGTRAKPYTDFSPKPLIPILDRPLIDHIIRYIARFKSVEEILVVTNLKGSGRQILNYFDGKEKHLRKRISFVDDLNEDTAIAVLRAKSKLRSGQPFIVWFSDNLSPIDLNDMMRFHSRTGGLGCVAVRSRRTEETGLARISKTGLVNEFLEKPTITLQTPECLGIYAFNYEILKRIADARAKKRKVNLSADILQKLSANDNFYAYDIGDTPWIDIESPAKMDRNFEDVKAIIEKMKCA